MKMTPAPASSLVLLGPTASGKTRLAVELAARLDIPVISIDSRQVYRGLDLASGKDLSEYALGDRSVSHRLIDQVELAEEFSLFDFAKALEQVMQELSDSGKPLLFCGGTGLYLDALLKGYQLETVPVDPRWRKEMEDVGLDELRQELVRLRPDQHNRTDLDERDRLLRAIEIARGGMEKTRSFPVAQAFVAGIRLELSELRERIEQRLDERMEQGMLQEIEALLEAGISPDRLERLGLEARWLVRQLTGQVDAKTAREQLAKDIYTFARGQGSWFRRMERQGLKIHWYDATSLDADRVHRDWQEHRQRHAA
jgi:tRNA dimethylallyltransferase